MTRIPYASISFLLIACGGLMQVCGEMASPPTQKPSPIQDWDLREWPYNRYNWSLRLDEIQLSPDGIVALKATLTNASNKNVTIDKIDTECELYYGTRLWTAKEDGSYSMIRKSQRVGRRKSEIVTLKPGESVSLTYGSLSDARTHTAKQAVRGCNELTYHRRHTPARGENTKAKLSSRKYTVDAMIDLSLLDIQPGSLPPGYDIVTICTDNKLWVELGE